MDLSKVSTIYLEKITDDFGVWQHAYSDKINYDEGYALDDVARGLIVFLLYGKTDQAKICLNYIDKSVTENNVVGFFSKERVPLVFATEDACGLALWACSYCIKNGFEVEKCKNIIDRLKEKDFINNTFHLRAICYRIISFILLDDQKNATKWLSELLKHYDPNAGWFEEYMSYANALIPMTIVYALNNKMLDDNSENKKMLFNSLKTLEKIYRIGVILAPIGNHVIKYLNTYERDVYGQQPIDGAFMIIMYKELYKYKPEQEYLDKQQDWIEWFTGNNIFKQSLIDEKLWRCADGIDDTGISTNFGSESTIMFFWALKYTA